MFSIIVPVLNEAELIELQLKPLQALRQSGHELIIVDGGSHDETVNLATPLADKIIRADKGRARQMNAGADIASGDVLLFLHIDTRLPDNLIQILGDPVDSNAWGFFRVCLDGQFVLLRIVERLMNLRSRMTAIATGDQALFVGKGLFIKAGGYPEIALMEDIALCKRLKQHVCPVCLNASVTTSSRRWERNGIIKTILQMWLFRLLYFFGVSPDLLVKWYYRDAKR